MSGSTVRLTYRGGDADHNLIDMRLLGQSLQGAEKIMSDGLIALVHERSPKRGERAPVLAKIREPEAGSYEFLGLWQAAAGLLPLAAPIAEIVLGEFMEQWWIAVKSRFTGKPEVVEKALETIIQINRDNLAARDASEARSHEREMAMISALRETLSLQQRSIEKFAAPVGTSVASAEVQVTHGRPVGLSTAEAEEVRERARVIWSDLTEMRLKTDGFKFHTNGLSIEHPTKDGFLMARVSDPAFLEPENVYTEAAQKRSDVLVLARRGFQDGNLVKIDIVDFITEVL